MTKKGGLGRGLGSLIPQKKPTQQTTPQEEVKDTTKEVSPKNILTVPKEISQETKGQLILEIPISQITTDPNQPRHYFDKDALEDLKNSIKEHGILQPLVVSKVDDDKYEIIAGERRFRSSKEIGLETVPVIVRTINKQQKLELALIENIQRENLNPIEEAKGYKRLADEFDLTQEEISKKLGKSRSQVANMVRLLDLPIRIQDALITGDITVGHAKTIASLPDEADQMELFKSIVRKNLNVRETEKESSKIKQKTPGFKNKDIKDPNIIEKEELLRDALSTKVGITKRGQRGKIEIEYYSEEELSGIIDKIIR